MGRKKTLPSREQQLSALKKKGVLTPDGRNRESGRKVTTAWSIYRLYSFYIVKKNPLSRPYFEAYAQQKRTVRRIEKQGVEATIATPKGKQSASAYIKKIDTSTETTLRRMLPPQVSIRYGKYYRTVEHVRDEFTYRIHPPIRVSQANVPQATKRSESVADDIVSFLRRLMQVRRILYRDHAAGAIIKYRTRDVETETGLKNPVGYIRVPWTRLPNVDVFHDALLEGMDRAVGIVYRYPEGEVAILRVDVYISTIWRSTNIDLLRTRT